MRGTVTAEQQPGVNPTPPAADSWNSKTWDDCPVCGSGHRCCPLLTSLRSCVMTSLGVSGFVLLLTLAISLAGASISPSALAAPEFVKEHSGNVTARVNGSAILNCRVRRLTARQVSWGRGFEVLTGGLMLFASDRRFQPLHQEYSEDWGLRILSVRASDAGWYFCQISTSPPVSHYLYLHVVDPQVEIIGGPERFIHQGSSVNLTCVIRRAHKMPENVRWTHENKLVEFDRSRSGVRVRTFYELRRTVSSVLISHVQPADSGTYYCDPDGLEHAKITVHVLADNNPAARTTSSASITVGGGAVHSAALIIFATRWLAEQKHPLETL
ncbi:uncharacterized protein LOC122370658 isoform X2 [Amphibalanus amphitrite]|uniref:uncharacterized protein LOC122370658 isoform X2 n=1 Tax=Amphibalanus amphitrite TaxID=1232801 RepID=UPI001C8FBA73|nr:uncharacterized protein LOC122370658 isoform X2 [Amphibalanus amphitrite]